MPELKPCPFCGRKADLPEFCRLIESDAEPVVHGHWIDQDSDCEDWHIHQHECSKCGMGDRHNSNVNVPYCWFCGAKMDEVQE